jgi:predicted HTH transcriptional regulator
LYNIFIMQSTKQKIEKIVKTREFSKFIGMEEDQWFEAKNMTPYDFNSATDRYELAKDVSSFANAEGGFIVFGLKHERLVEKNIDKVKELDLMNETDFDKQKIEGLINEYVHPAIKELKIEWIESKDEKGKGVGIVTIPNQHENYKYFLIKNVVEEENSIKQIIFGIAQRKRSSSKPFSIDELYDAIQRGKNELSERLSSLEAKIDVLIESTTTPETSIVSPESKIEERVGEIISRE